VPVIESFYHLVWTNMKAGSQWYFMPLLVQCDITHCLSRFSTTTYQMCLQFCWWDALRVTRMLHIWIKVLRVFELHVKHQHLSCYINLDSEINL